MIDVYIYFSYKYTSLISRGIGLYSFYHCVLGWSVLKSIAITLKHIFNVKENEHFKNIFSHAGIMLELNGVEYIVESDYKHGIIVRRSDLHFVRGMRVVRFPYRIHLREFVERFFQIKAREFECRWRRKHPLGFIGYYWRDVLSFLFPYIRGRETALICSEFVYKMFPDLFRDLKHGCSVVSPNELYAHLHAKFGSPEEFQPVS